MPRLTNSVPKYCKHRASGQAIVTLNGKDHYLGPYGTKTSRIEYDRLIGEWVSNGRRLTQVDDGLTIVELIAAYWKFAEQYYRKSGGHTSELANIKHAVKNLKTLYGHSLVHDFGPLALKAIQARMISDGLSRGVINQRVAKIKRMFRWAVSEQLAPPSLCHALESVMGLRRGRTDAREAPAVTPVDDATVTATIPHLPAIVADMVRFQRATGARPNEVCIVRPCDIDRTTAVWVYRPASHKTEHHGRDRVILIGPRGQDVLRPYLLRESTAYCFSPIEAENARKSALRECRKTPVQPSQQNRAKKNPRRKPGLRYTPDSYLWAIRRACAIAFPAPEELEGPHLRQWRKSNWWSPNQLRHSAASEIRKRFGVEQARVILGHSNLATTEIYAERDIAMAAEVMAQVG